MEVSDILDSRYDAVFQQEIPHLSDNGYPEMLPFVGKNWLTSKKILLLGESHYMDYDKLSRDYPEHDYLNDWYQGSSAVWKDDWLKSYLQTRHNILCLENPSRKVGKPLLMYSNIRKSLRQISPFNESESVFTDFAYYNYFQKPASERGPRSVQPNSQDSQMAHKTFLKVLEVIEPKQVIFASIKAYNLFRQKHGKSELPCPVDFVPHAGRPWWHRKSWRYGNLKGKEKFIKIVIGLYPQ